MWSKLLEHETLTLSPVQTAFLPPQTKSVTISVESTHHADCDWAIISHPVVFDSQSGTQLLDLASTAHTADVHVRLER
jgi:hypothetical protein